MNAATDPRRFLFALWEGGGNVPPQLGLARRMVERGHRVRVLADPCIEEDVRAAGCEFVPWRRAPHRADRSAETDLIRDWEVKSPLQQFGRLRDRVMFGPALAYAHDVIEELDRHPADVAAIDWVLTGALAGAERAGVPIAALAHTCYSVPTPGMPAPGPGFLPARGPLGRLRDAVFGRLFLRVFATGLPVLNAARRELGLEPLGEVWEMFGRVDRLLVLTSQAFDFPAEVLPPNVRYVGPQLDDPAWAGPWESPWPAGHPDPLVVVSLSTTPQNQAGVVQKAIDALGGLPVRGLATTGPALDPGGLRVPENVRVRRSAPHARVFPEAAAVVTHAGHGTVIRALAAGVPLVCVPMGRDQPDIAARVVWRGAGLRVSPGASVGALREAVRRVVEEPGFREGARRVAAGIAEEARRPRAVEELESLARGAAVAV